jgi:hypothetical protein
MRRYSVQTGAKGGMIAFLVLFLVAVGIPAVLAGVHSTGAVGGSPDDWAAEVARNMLLILLAGLPVAAGLGRLGGATMGLSCYWIIKRGYPDILALLSGAIIGAAAGFLVQTVLAIGFISIMTGRLSVGYVWGCSPFTCAATGFAGFIISREIIRQHLHLM